MKILNFFILSLLLFTTFNLQAQVEVGWLDYNAFSPEGGLFIDGNELYASFPDANSVARWDFTTETWTEPYAGSVSSISMETNTGLYIDPLNSGVTHDSENWRYEVNGSLLKAFDAMGNVQDSFTLVEGRQVAFDLVNGVIAVTDYGADKVYFLTEKTLIPLDSIESITNPFGIGFMADGNCLVGSQGQMDIIYADLSSGTIDYVEHSNFDLAGSTAILGDITGIAVNFTDGLVYAAEADYGVIRIIDISGISLPIDLVSFTARLSGGKHLFTWKTALENNAYGFEIQHSLDGQNWDAIGFVKARYPEGGSYSFAVPAVNGLHYYRLKMVDLDGSFTYSDRISLEGGQEKEKTVFPNPSHGDIFLSDAAKIYHQSGQLIAATNEPNQILYGLESGLYVIKFKSGEIQKLVIVK